MQCSHPPIRRALACNMMHDPLCLPACPAAPMTSSVRRSSITGALVTGPVTAVVTSGPLDVMVAHSGVNQQTGSVEVSSSNSALDPSVLFFADAGSGATLDSISCVSSCAASAPAGCTNPILPTSGSASFGVGASYTIECTATSDKGGSTSKTFTLVVQLGESGSWSGGGGVNGKRGVGLSCACSADQSGAGGLAAGQVLACASRLTRPLLAGIAATECAALNGQPVSECTSWGHMSLRARMH